MAADPEKLKRFSLLNPTARAHVQDPDFLLWLQGADEGRKDMKQEVLTLLQNRFMDPKIDQTSPEGQAILKIARTLAEELKTK